jgi:hypothetical protein
VWVDNAIDCSQLVQVQFIDGSSYKGTVRFSSIVAATVDGSTQNTSFAFSSPTHVVAPVFHGCGCLNSFDGFTCVLFMLAVSTSLCV